MATPTTPQRSDADLAVAPAESARAARSVRSIGTLLQVAGILLILAGILTWIMVQTSLSDENITVADDAAMFAGEKVNGPLTAFSQAEIIEKHALEATGGKTYAELDREDPAREVVQNGSFLRASLFTSVVSFGVAAMAVGLGVVVLLIGIALSRTAKALSHPYAT